MKEIEFEGSSVAEAIQSGLTKLNIKKEESDIKILDEGTNGLFGFVGIRPAKVRIKMKNPAALHQGNSQNEELSEIAQRVKTVLENITKHMGMSDSRISVTETEGMINADIDGPDQKLIIGKNGRTLNALQVLVPIMALAANRGTRVRINIDAGGYLKEKDSKLIELAKMSAEKVKSTGKDISLEPMPSRERMMVHITLKDIEGVTTVSEGEGDTRRVLIKLQ